MCVLTGYTICESWYRLGVLYTDKKSEIQNNRQTDIISYFYLTRAYIKPSSGSQKHSENIDLLKSNPKGT